MIRKYFYALAGFVLATLASTAAMAAPDAGGFVIQTGEAVGYVITMIFASVSAFAGYALNFVVKRYKLSIDDKTREYLLGAIGRAISLGEDAVKSRTSGLTQIEVRSQIVAEAATYVLSRVPDALKHFGITEDNLKGIITAKLVEKANA